MKQKNPAETGFFVRSCHQSLFGFHDSTRQGVALADGLQDIHAARQTRQIKLYVVAAFSIEALYLLSYGVEETNFFDVCAVHVHHILGGIRIDAEQGLFRLFYSRALGDLDVELIGACLSFKIGHDAEIERAAADGEAPVHDIVAEVRPVVAVCRRGKHGINGVIGAGAGVV